MTEPELGEFGKAVVRLLHGQRDAAYEPGPVSIAKLAREADVDYAHLHSVIRGRRGDKAVKPSVDLAQRIITAIEDLGLPITPMEEAELMQAAAGLPEGFRVVRSDTVASLFSDETESPRQVLLLTPEEVQILSVFQDLPADRRTQILEGFHVPLSLDRLREIEETIISIPDLEIYKGDVLAVGSPNPVVTNDSDVDHELCVFFGNSKSIVEDLLREIKRVRALL